jgi:predicted  nucleic acid-binding Zn-ribbon protein
VQTNKEYDAISKEIDTVQIEISSRETKVLQLWSREEELKELLEQLHNTQNTSGKEYQEKSVELNKKLAETQGEKLQLEHEREKLVMKLKKPVYNHYERIRKVRDGKGVADVYNGACGGCFSTIPPQRLVEIENMTDFIFCETCGRILVMNSEMNY